MTCNPKSPLALAATRTSLHNWASRRHLPENHSHRVLISNEGMSRLLGTPSSRRSNLTGASPLGSSTQGAFAQLHSPARNQQSSADIVRSVLATPHSGMETSFGNLAIGTPSRSDYLHQHDSPQFGEVSKTDVSTVLPSPPSSNPQIAARHYLEYLRHRRADVRLGAISALHKIGPAAAIENVAEVLAVVFSEGPVEERFAYMAMEILEWSGRYAAIAIQPIVKVASSTPRVAAVAARALIASGQEGIHALLDTAADATGGLDTVLLPVLANHPACIRAVIVPALVKECAHSDGVRRSNAVKGLGALGQLAEASGEAIAPLLATGSVDRADCAAALRAFGRGGEDYLARLAVQDQNARVRAAAVRGLSLPSTSPLQQVEICVRPASFPGAGPAITLVSASVEGHSFAIEIDERSLVAGCKRALAVNAFVEALELTELGSSTQYSGILPQSISAIAQCLQDPVPTVREAAAEAVGVIGLPLMAPCVKELVKSLRDGDPQVRMAAAATLGQLGPGLSTTGVDSLAALLKDSHYSVRHAACVALGKVGAGTPNVVPSLIKVLRDGSVNRQAAAASLASGGTDGVEALCCFVREVAKESAPVRVAAVYGLSVLNPAADAADTAVDTLFEASHDRTPSVRKASIDALSLLGSQPKTASPLLKPRSLLPFLYSFLKDHDKAVREAAASALAQAGSHGELLLIEGILKDTNSIIRGAASYGLQCLGPKSFRTLLLALGDRESSVRACVSASIEAIGLVPLWQMMKERPRSQRESVLFSLQEILSSPYPFPPALLNVIEGLVDRLADGNSSIAGSVV